MIVARTVALDIARQLEGPLASGTAVAAPDRHDHPADLGRAADVVADRQRHRSSPVAIFVVGSLWPWATCWADRTAAIRGACWPSPPAAGTRPPRLALASANFPNTDEHAAVALYGLVTALAGGIYTVIAKRWSPSRSSR